MPDPFWGNLQKSVTDSELIEAAIARISQLYSSMLAFGTWGMVPKSQSNPDTIDDQIDADIIAHNADESAHLAAGQSLQSHKAAEIIDHIAGSVVADKLARVLSDGLLFREDGRTFDVWSLYQIGASSEVVAGILQLYCHIEDPSPARADAAGIFGGYSITYASEILWLDFMANFSGGNSVDTWVSVGYGTLYVTGNGFGFRYKKSDGHLYAFHRIGATFYDTDLGEPPADEFHKYRVNFSAGAFTFYVDDVLVATHNTNIPTGSNTTVITLGCVVDPTGSGSLELRFLEYYQSSGMVPG
ncbi:MAG: hypothetical protein NT116_04780 [Candidatus Parcubacteria bacterium]|nr:hypothetical protein [Candidatus Parcubacteria bacterium]